MIDTTNEVLSLTEKRDQQLISSMERIFSAARVNAVFGEPVVSGNYTVITACEVSAGGGFGSGMDSGRQRHNQVRHLNLRKPVAAVASVVVVLPGGDQLLPSSLGRTE
jgi:uncharacterized spore protein YtfJ